MGIAAYRRGNVAISRQLAPTQAERDGEHLRDLNATPRHERAVAPWGPIHFVPGNGGWWAQCPKTGFGYWYKTLRRAIAEWRVTLTEVGMRGGEVVYVAVPTPEGDHR